jgi:gamma-glutamylcyclotransferase (GGCT)/AIG2-like uncharacterized protein YtfP
MHRVFVYGTLKQGHGNHRLLSAATFVGRCIARLPYRFVDLGSFPGLVRTNPNYTLSDVREDFPASRMVGGEVYEVNDQQLLGLDYLEGHPRFYERFEVDTPLGKVWTYTLPPSYGRHEEISSIFWRQTDDELGWLAHNATDDELEFHAEAQQA